ncbi:glycerophosphodiester phosphodiesterase family protein [Streptomyces monticola]|uniref:Glycerophosphodiester phosphodiesterase family protein n=1 Tax=Streptomyces monticola TaxID=2666263 RepID=A0ABW2JM73_9ACTN
MTPRRTPRLTAIVALALVGTGLSAANTQAMNGSSVDRDGRGGRETAAERALRDFLDHGPGAKILTAAHRGQWRKAPENSLPATRAAFADGAEIAELDVRLSRDGHPVLMHDPTVDRTTNGTGRVADLTLAQLRSLRLKAGLGGAQAPLTGERVPTLAEAMKVAGDRGLVNLDKGWPIREEMYDVLKATGTVRNALFKSEAPVDEVQAFREAHPDALYLHQVADLDGEVVDEFGDAPPLGYEVGFVSERDALARRPVIGRMRATGRLWINAMWHGLAGRHTDEASLTDPARGWKALTGTFGADIIQTDNVAAFESWLRTGHGDPRPPGALRIQAEGFARGGEGVAYHDTTPGNRQSAARATEDVDVCDLDGAVAVCWIRGGEWIDYHFTVAAPGRYALAARVSSPYSPAGTYRVAFDGDRASGPVRVRNTTGHSAFFLQESGVVRELGAGRHRLRIRMEEAAFQNFNLDYVQLRKVVR